MARGQSSGLFVFGLALVLTTGLRSAAAGLLDGALPCTAPTCGTFSAPFAEPTIAGQPTTAKCIPDSNGELICKPAAGTMAMLADGADPLLVTGQLVWKPAE